MFEKFCDVLCLEKRFITVEVNPPHGASVDAIIADIKKHKLDEKVTGFPVQTTRWLNSKCQVYSLLLKYSRPLVNPSLPQ